ncbi:MAG: hypothetical protein JWO10_1915 [Microbacteriaceae bacterium]|nr:hypothetical protein [Microbacteriaceae bacterium]
MDDISTLIADIYEAAGALRMSGDEIANAEGITLTQWHLLDALIDPGVTVARAARRIGLSRQAVQKVANEMVKTGMIEFVDNPDHKTSPLLEITAAGRAIQERLWAAAELSHEARFGTVSASALETTRQTLRTITEQTYSVHGQG